MSYGVWIDGVLRDAADAVVPYDDHAVTVGDGVFETMKLTAGVPFARRRHLERLARSADALEIPMPSEEELREAVDAVAASAAGDPVAYLRLTLTAGPGPLGSNRDDVAPRLIVAIRPGSVRVDPTDVVVAPWPRNERGALAGVKSTSYAENVRALLVAGRFGAGEALFANTRGELCEGTGSNVFVGFGDELLTPPLSSGCLEGVTRDLLLEAGVGREQAIPMERVGDATEMFLASTGREVQPVMHLDGHALQWCSGPLTVAAARTWTEKIVHLVDP